MYTNDRIKRKQGYRRISRAHVDGVHYEVVHMSENHNRVYITVHLFQVMDKIAIKLRIGSGR